VLAVRVENRSPAREKERLDGFNGKADHTTIPGNRAPKPP
jgi:hypothetical protein